MCVLVMQWFRNVYCEISHDSIDLIFQYTHKPLGGRVHTKKNQVTSGIFHIMPQENIA